MVKDAALSAVTSHVYSLLPWFLLAVMLIVKRVGGDDKTVTYSSHILPVPWIAIDLLPCSSSVVVSTLPPKMVTSFPFCQHTGRPVLLCSAAGDRVRLRAQSFIREAMLMVRLLSSKPLASSPF
jgi:hypothetical protein